MLTTLLLLTPLLAAEGPDPLVEAALATHPDLAALSAQVDALEAAAAGAGTWMDPMIGLEVSSLPLWTFRLGDHPMAGVQVKAQQTLPAPGTNAADAEAALARVPVGEQRLEEARDALTRSVELAWWDLALSRQLEAVTQAHLARTEELLQAVMARYEVGAAGQHAVVRLELLRDRLGDDLGNFTARQAALTAALAAATAHSQEPPFETPAEVTPLAVAGTAATWLDLAVESRPELARVAAEARAAEAEAEAARLSARPDVTVWAGYRLRTYDMDPRDLVTLGVSMPIPMGSRTRADAREASALAMAQAARSRLDGRTETLTGQLEALHARWTRAADKARTYQESLLPSAQASLETTLSDYTVGRADFASLYEAEVTLLTLERTWRTATLDTWRIAAEVRALIGAEPTGDTP